MFVEARAPAQMKNDADLKFGTHNRRDHNWIWVFSFFFEKIIQWPARLGKLAHHRYFSISLRLPCFFFFRKSDPKYKILEKLQWIVDFHIYPWLPSFLFCVPIYHTTNRYISLFSFSETHCLNWFHQIHVVRTLIVFKSTWRRRNGFSKSCCVLCTNSGLTPDKMKKTAETWNLVHTLPDTISKNRVFGFIFKKWSNWPPA